MKIRILVYALLIFIIVIIQSVVLDYIKIYDVKPNLFIVFVICIALLRGNVEGAIIGFIFGVFQDVVSGKILGFYALLGLYLGLIIGSVNKRLYRENIFVILFFTLISSVTYEMAVYILSTFLSGKIDLFFPLRDIILPEAVYNCVVSIFMYIFVIKLNDRFQRSAKISRKY